jgi:hypothetical protein
MGVHGFGAGGGEVAGALGTAAGCLAGASDAPLGKRGVKVSSKVARSADKGS